MKLRSIERQLWLIKEKFPLFSARIQELYESDPDFESLCSDYLLCLNVLEDYQQEPLEKQEDIREYEDIKMTLEKDLHDFLVRA